MKIVPEIPAPIAPDYKALYEQERDIRRDREICLQLMAESLDVAPEPHQTYFERLVQAASSDRPAVTEAMVDRFLSWKLPEDFHPDAGISFSPYFNVEYNAKHGKPPQRHEPIGTNLLTAVQAKAMLEHVLIFARPEELSAEWVPEAAKQTGEVLRARSSEMFPWECINDASSRPHIKDMLGKLERREISGNKAHRWLGWAQGVICARAGVPLETFKTINKAASLTRSPPMRTKPKECENGCPPQQVCDYCQGVRSCKPQLWQSK